MLLNDVFERCTELFFGGIDYLLAVGTGSL